MKQLFRSKAATGMGMGGGITAVTAATTVGTAATTMAGGIIATGGDIHLRRTDQVRLSDIEPRFVRKACGKRGADVRPDFCCPHPPPRSRGRWSFRLLSGRSISSYEGTWVLSDHDSSAAPQTVQIASPVCGIKNFSSVRLYSAPQLH
jgi:hypothetical protein